MFGFFGNTTAPAPDAPVQDPANAEDGNVCVVCLAAPKTHLMAPCGHKCVCAECSKLFSDKVICPVCRAPIQCVVQVFE